MLNCPYLGQPFEPNITRFIGGLDVYDQEETLGAELWALNPNDTNDREFIIKKHVLNRFDKYSHAHKYLFIDALHKALTDNTYNFDILFQDSIEEYISMAWNAEQLDTPRSFFEDIYRLARDEWRKDIEIAQTADQIHWQTK